MELLPVMLTSMLVVTQAVTQDLSPRHAAALQQVKTREFVKLPEQAKPPKKPKQDPAVATAAVIVSCAMAAALVVLALSEP